MNWARQWEVFHAVLECAPENRTAELLRRTGDNPALRRDVERLLEHASDTGDLLEHPEELRFALLEASREGERIGPYRLGTLLGEGGTGEVYAAERCDGQFAQRVAIKLLKPGFDDSAFLQRFLQERQILARLAHPGIARLLDGGVSSDGQPYIVLELVDGAPIDAYCRGRPPGEIIGLLMAVCRAVDAAHRNLVVHRDLKPRNILVTADGTPKILDFGIARPMQNTGTTATVGRMLTPRYASPEQVRGEPVTTATDTYSLGVIAYELLTGRSPYGERGERAHELPRAILESEPPPPSRVVTDRRLARRLRGDLDTIVLKALHKDPDRRYAAPSELADDLDRYRRSEPVRARRDTLRYRLGRLAARHPWRLGAAASFVVLLAAAVVVTGTLSIQLRSALEGERRERRAAEAVAEFMVDAFQSVDPAGAAGAAGAEVPAQELLDAGVVRIRGNTRMPPELRVGLLTVMGRAYAGLQRVPQAIELLEDARGLAAKLDDPRRLARIEGLLAGAILNSDEPGEALPLVERALQRLADAGGASGELALQLSTVQARAMTRAGRLAEARDELAQTAGRARREGRQAIEGSALVALGDLQRRSGDLEEAKRSLERAVTLRRLTHGNGHPYTATAVETLADVLSDAGSYREAETLYVEALESVPETADSFDPWRADILNDLAVARQRYGNLAGAETAYREALALKTRLHGAEHPALSSTMLNLGWLLHDTGRYGEALALYRRALALDETVYGERHTSLLPKLNNLGLLHLDRGELDRAGPLLERGLDISLSELGSEHPILGYWYSNLGRLAFLRGDADRAESLYQRALELRRRELPAGHPDLAGTLTGLGRVLTATGRAAEAAPLFDEALEIRRGRLAADSWQIALTECERAAAVAALGRTDEARDALMHCAPRIAAQRGAADPRARRAESLLARLR